MSSKFGYLEGQLPKDWDRFTPAQKAELEKIHREIDGHINGREVRLNQELKSMNVPDSIKSSKPWDFVEAMGDFPAPVELNPSFLQPPTKNEKSFDFPTVGSDWNAIGQKLRAVTTPLLQQKSQMPSTPDTHHTRMSPQGTKSLRSRYGYFWS